MELNNLKPAAGSVKNQGKRVGRGQGSGGQRPPPRRAGAGPVGAPGRLRADRQHPAARPAPG